MILNIADLPNDYSYNGGRAHIYAAAALPIPTPPYTPLAPSLYYYYYYYY